MVMNEAKFGFMESCVTNVFGLEYHVTIERTQNQDDRKRNEPPVKVHFHFEKGFPLSAKREYTISDESVYTT